MQVQVHEPRASALNGHSCATHVHEYNYSETAQHSLLSELLRSPRTRRPSKHCSVFAVDIAGFGKRDNDVQRAVRHTLFASLRDAFGHAHVPWNGCYCRDSGDGILAAVPAQFPTLWLADPLIRNLSAALHRHNRLHHETARIQLRAAFASSPTTTAYPASPSSICSVCCNQPPSNML